jgi:hypothetical protein
MLRRMKLVQSKRIILGSSSGRKKDTWKCNFKKMLAKSGSYPAHDDYQDGWNIDGDDEGSE